MGAAFGPCSHARTEVGENRTRCITTACAVTRDSHSSLSRSNLFVRRERSWSPHWHSPSGRKLVESKFAVAAGRGPKQPHLPALGKCLCLVTANAMRGWGYAPAAGCAAWAGSRLCHGAPAPFNSPCRSCWTQKAFGSQLRAHSPNHWSSQ